MRPDFTIVPGESLGSRVARLSEEFKTHYRSDTPGIDVRRARDYMNLTSEQSNYRKGIAKIVGVLLLSYALSGVVANLQKPVDKIFSDNKLYKEQGLP